MVRFQISKRTHKMTFEIKTNGKLFLMKAQAQ